MSKGVSHSPDLLFWGCRSPESEHGSVFSIRTRAQSGRGQDVLVSNGGGEVAWEWRVDFWEEFTPKFLGWEYVWVFQI